MIKVAVFISGGEKGGSRYQVLRILEGLKDKVDFSFFTFHHGSLTKDIINKKYKNYFFSSLYPIKEIREILVKEKFDLIHTYGFRGNFYGRISNKRLNIPLISTYTGFMRDDYNSRLKGVIFEKIDDFTLNYPNLIIVSSKSMEEYIRKRGYKKIIRIVHLGIDITTDSYNREDFGLSDEDFVIGSVLRFEKVKNPLFLIEIFNLILKLEKRAKLLLVGDGSLRDEIKKKIFEYGISDRVILTGFREDARKIYKIFDVFVLTSHKEGFSISTIEAMSSSIPVVVSDSGGVRDVVEDGVNGFIIKNFDKKDFVDKILLFKDRNLKREFGERNRKKVIEKFNSSKMCNETFLVYKEVLG